MIGQLIVITEIVILAVIAAFLGLRLYSVLGERSEHEEEPARHRFDAPDGQVPPAAQPAAQPVRQPVQLRSVDNASSANESAIRAIASADPRFDLLAFLEGAKAAYGMVLEAFWNGDKETLRELTDDDVYAGFSAAIDAREAAGEKLENRLIRIEDATIHSAELDKRTARIAVLFVSDIASLTRDKDGNVIDGSLDDAVESRDIWTFTRNVDALDPNWVLDETDQG
nr:Tim44/TimA family putative adaptor protein [Qipengyuania polymorpha]